MSARSFIWEMFEFQSAPGDEAGRNEIYPLQLLLNDCFNPLPAMKPGGTPTPRIFAQVYEVSIRSRR